MPLRADSHAMADDLTDRQREFLKYLRATPEEIADQMGVGESAVTSLALLLRDG